MSQFDSIKRESSGRDPIGEDLSAREREHKVLFAEAFSQMIQLSQRRQRNFNVSSNAAAEEILGQAEIVDTTSSFDAPENTVAESTLSMEKTNDNREAVESQSDKMVASSIIGGPLIGTQIGLPIAPPVEAHTRSSNKLRPTIHRMFS